MPRGAGRRTFGYKSVCCPGPRSKARAKLSASTRDVEKPLLWLSGTWLLHCEPLSSARCTVRAKRAHTPPTPTPTPPVFIRFCCVMVAPLRSWSVPFQRGSVLPKLIVPEAKVSF